MPAPRTLEDWDPLKAERRLATEMGDGQPVIIGPDLPPDPPPPDRVIRASFLRALILGQVTDCPVHERGVWVAGAFIEGDGPARAETRGLNLQGCDLSTDLALIYCRLPDLLLLRDANLRNLLLGWAVLDGGLAGDRLAARGRVVLDKANVQGLVRLWGNGIGW